MKAAAGASMRERIPLSTARYQLDLHQLSRLAYVVFDLHYDRTVAAAQYCAVFADFCTRVGKIRYTAFMIWLSLFNGRLFKHFVLLLPTRTTSIGVSRTFKRVGLSVRLSVCLSVCKQRNSETNVPKLFKLGTWNGIGIYWKCHGFGIEKSKVKVTVSITLHSDTLFQTTIAIHSHSLGGATK